ncbi:hypothetical protein BpHYR1_050445 [Brachionus plicatilis]|uniref:Uncharacterized protein n=1 Tax=Brachionus plicatilis TaxID=10195 RepID=A0A3M7R859_BRAPC|nr:hypothetical protein BpHYR1_050445 [Brachionus plicatilis]
MDRADPENYLCEKKLVEFMHDLQKALQQGKIRDEANKSQGFLNQTNIDSLSNQTFMYIVNWLKNHQTKKEQKVSSTLAYLGLNLFSELNINLAGLLTHGRLS